MSTHNLCFEQKYGKISEYLSENFHFFGGKIYSIYMNKLVFVMENRGWKPRFSTPPKGPGEC